MHAGASKSRPMAASRRIWSCGETSCAWLHQHPTLMWILLTLLSSSFPAARGQTIINFTTVGATTWTAPASMNFQVMVVAGGGEVLVCSVPPLRFLPVLMIYCLFMPLLQEAEDLIREAEEAEEVYSTTQATLLHRARPTP